MSSKVILVMESARDALANVTGILESMVGREADEDGQITEQLAEVNFARNLLIIALQDKEDTITEDN